MNHSDPHDHTPESVDYPQRRPFYVDLLGILTGFLLLFGVGLWFTMLYSPKQLNSELYSLVISGLGISFLAWLIFYFRWMIKARQQRRKRLSIHRQKANAQYHLGEVRQEIDSRRQ